MTEPDQGLQKFTDEERSIIAGYLRAKATRADHITRYCIYLLPSLVFAAYGIYKSDFAALVVAYVVLVIAVLAGWSYQNRYAAPFRAAVRKCLDRIAELEGDAPPPEATASD